MGLSAPAFALAKCVVELPRLATLTAAFLGTWYPTAAPRCGFADYYWPCFCAALAVSGYAHVLNIAQDPKSAQLSTVSALVACAMFSGVTPRLEQLDNIGVFARIADWLSYSRGDPTSDDRPSRCVVLRLDFESGRDGCLGGEVRSNVFWRATGCVLECAGTVQSPNRVLETTELQRTNLQIDTVVLGVGWIVEAMYSAEVRALSTALQLHFFKKRTIPFLRLFC